MNKTTQKLCIIVSSSITIKAFMLNHLKYLSGPFELTVITDEYIDYQKEYNLAVKSIPISISRKISIIKDIKSLFQLYKFLRKERFDVILSTSPKSGLIAMVAARFSRSKIRIHIFGGHVWESKKGIFRCLLRVMDKVTVFYSSYILTVSNSQRNFLINERIIIETKSSCIHKGSISGVDINKFKSNKELSLKLRAEHGINNELVFMFLGRLNQDKGILDLNVVFHQLFQEHQDIKLILVGPSEEGIDNQIDKLLQKDNVIRIGYVSNPEEILNLADVLVLPSYREGFGTIVIEAAAMKIPTIGSNIYGLNDAIVDGETGLLHEKANLSDMKQKYERVISDKLLISKLGNNAYERVVRDFNSDTLSEALCQFILGRTDENNF
jgi:glycosyltransferase involved in cell wall biosynthesis